MIDRPAIAVTLACASGMISQAVPSNAWGLVFSACACFLTGVAARHLIESEYRRRTAFERATKEGK